MASPVQLYPQRNRSACPGRDAVADPRLQRYSRIGPVALLRSFFFLSHLARVRGTRKCGGSLYDARLQYSPRCSLVSSPLPCNLCSAPCFLRLPSACSAALLLLSHFVCAVLHSALRTESTPPLRMLFSLLTSHLRAALTLHCTALYGPRAPRTTGSRPLSIELLCLTHTSCSIVLPACAACAPSCLVHMPSHSLPPTRLRRTACSICERPRPVCY